ncbi:putative hydrolase [Sediminihabitans luteus]|uniref:Putative hydrolase n=1 Tax=Sediminihabitans luteus TaxID=1138585 RepID=A0A2M9CZC3_9CELL|nr:zinc-dependent metalloprotease [Sediminihabitans luteus]PJJ77088.1 putative hydrolase [Sediminihabitans luteus]GIJ00393.1 hypothetical protein Slu03_27700 [Sediminihabitans luteus]
MSSNTPDDPSDRTPDAWEQMLRSMFGADADEAMRQMRERGLDPQALARGVGLGDNPQAMSAVLAQVQRMLSASGDGPVNTDVAHDVARQVAVRGGDPVVTGAQAKSALSALSVAELWLDAVTDLPPAGGPARAWSRSEWVEATLPAWNALVAPVAGSVSAALATVMRDQLGALGDEIEIPGLPQGALGGALGGLDPAALMRRLGSAVFGMQTGQAAGTLSREVFGATDVGVPLLDDPATVLLPANVEEFAEGLDAPLDEVRLFLALREVAHARLFTHVPWLRSHLLAIVGSYARGITIDLEALEERVRGVDITDTAALQSALSGNVFRGQNTPEQRETLGRLETTLALVEGWVDEVTATAALPHLPHAVPLREMVRRRRAAGGPAEQVFASLVGLELRPRRSRDAAALWAFVTSQTGTAGRDAVWDHPDLLPDAQDLDAPTQYYARREAEQEVESDLDRALAQIFDEAAAEDGADDVGGEAPGHAASDSAGNDSAGDDDTTSGNGTDPAASDSAGNGSAGNGSAGDDSAGNGSAGHDDDAPDDGSPR